MLTTALEDMDKMVKAIEISIDKYLPKPIDLKKLEKILLEFVEALATKNAVNKNRKLLEDYKKALDSAAILTITDPDDIIKNMSMMSLCILPVFQKKRQSETPTP